MQAAKAQGKRRPSLADALVAALLLAGCLTNQTASQNQSPDTNGESSLLAEETGDMGNISVAAALLKRTAAKSDSVDVSLQPLRFDGNCQCHVRSVTIRTSGGYERERIDTVHFRDADNKSLRFPTLARVKTVTHKRWVRQAKSGREAEILIVTGMVLNAGASDTTATWNGNISGSYGGSAYRDGKITDLVRKLASRRWQFPHSGSIAVEGEHASLAITFQGNGTANAVRTSKATGKSVTVTLDADYKENP